MLQLMKMKKNTSNAIGRHQTNLFKQKMLQNKLQQMYLYRGLAEGFC